MKAVASFQTSSANRYLAMLCGHFGKKVKAKCGAGVGWVQFPFGRCDMTADEKHLEMQVSAEDQTQLRQLKHIVTSHLERFAFRENPNLDWHDASTPPPSS
ncbi:MAG: DUF2218 domain-containing protein [Pseudomonadota bacterium]